jgi:hypothetical protein
VLLGGDPNAAKISFTKASGQSDYSRDRAGTVAGNVLAMSTPDPLINVVVGAGTLILAPFAAARAAVTARHRLDEEQLADSEVSLASAMQAMAEQPRFHQWLLEAANNRRPSQLLSVDQLQQHPRRRVDAILLARIEELRLERATDSDASFRLYIKASTRLVRADGTVLYEQPTEYRSDPGLFVDWARQPSIQNVTDTAYRALSKHLVDQLLGVSDTPLQIGAGYRHSPGFDRYEGLKAVSSRLPLRAPPQPSALQWVNQVDTRTLGIYSTASVANVRLQLPRTRQEAHAEALEETEWMMDGLPHHPNMFVAVTASAVAIPISLWKQGAAITLGLAPRTVRVAQAKLDAVANLTQPHQELAFEMAQCLKPATSQRVMLVKHSLPQGAEKDPDLMRCLSHGTMTWLPEGQTIDRYLTSQGADHALEIRVLSANLEGEAGINPKLTLCVEAQATLLRPGDGQSFCSCPVRYRSEARTFTEWAAHDAAPFRQELQKCYRQVSAALADQLIQRGLIPEQARPPATFVNTGRPAQP